MAIASEAGRSSEGPRSVSLELDPSAIGSRARRRMISALSAVLLGALLLERHASAQPAPAPARPADPARPTEPARNPAPAPVSAPTATTPAGELGPGDPDTTKADPLALALAPQRGGLTPEGVAKEAIATSPSVRGRQADVTAAEGQTSQSMVSFFPRLTLVASYTRLSALDPTSLGGGNSVGTQNPGGLKVAPCTDGSGDQCVVDSGGVPAQSRASNLSSAFPVILNQISFTGNLTVPLSDYFLRSVQAYSAAQHNEQAVKLQLAAQNLQAGAEAKIALLQWIQSKGQTVVARLAIEQVQKQLSDAKTGVQVGTASLADVMRIEARLAQAQFQEADAKAVETIAEENLRTLVHAPPDRSFEIGIDVLTQPAAPRMEASDALLGEALRNRLEIRAIEEQRAYLDKAADVTAAGYAPRLDAFADATLANPNQRVFPSQEKFRFTWDVGARLTWVVNDTFSTLGAVKAARARTSQVDSQKQVLVDAVRREVTGAQADVAKAVPSIEAADRGVAASEETLRVTRKLFAFGKATGTQIVDAEQDLTSSRLRKLAAHVNLIAAQIRLEHAVGRDRTKADR